MAPRFSILLPTRRRDRLLGFAIASALAQTEPDFELLIVGDGCTPESAAVVAGFTDTRIRWFDLPKAFGFGYANRNVALREARGEYVAFLGDDDLLLPDHLARLALTLDRSGAEWAYSRPLWVTTDGLIVPFSSNLLNADELETFVTVGNHIPATCVMYRRTCLDTYGYWPEDVPRAGDWRYWIRIIEGGGRKHLACDPAPTTLHFHADWKTTPDQHMGPVVAARELAEHAAWWPSGLKVAMAPGVPEQAVFASLIREPGAVDRLRHDVAHVVDRLAWIQITETPALLSRLRAETQARIAERDAEAARARTELSETRARMAAAERAAAGRLADVQGQLDTVRSSKSWRATAPLRSLSGALDRLRRR